MIKYSFIFGCLSCLTCFAQKDSSFISFHFQATSISQYHTTFKSPYEGNNSLVPNEKIASSLTNTLYLAAKPWKNGLLILNPEIAGGLAFSGTTGMAGFPNGEIFRVGNPKPTIYLARLILEQIFPLNKTNFIYAEDAGNVVRGLYPADYIKFFGGRFCLADFFDGNPYNHDPRSQFMNWSFMSAGAWDYAADTRGYTWGAGSEWKKKNWRAALAFTMEPAIANALVMDKNIPKALASQIEFTHFHTINNKAGQIQATFFFNRAHMGNYEESLKLTPVSPDITSTANYKNHKWGWVINAAQQLNASWGSFLRLSWNDGKNETWAFTEIDRSINAGITWSRNLSVADKNVFGAGVVVNGISKQHRDYLAAGGYGFIIGDGRLNYAPEYIAEMFYRFNLFNSHFQLSPDFQFAINPAYNKDRGPVPIFSLRSHFEF